MGDSPQNKDNQQNLIVQVEFGDCPQKIKKAPILIILQ